MGAGQSSQNKRAFFSSLLVHRNLADDPVCRQG